MGRLRNGVRYAIACSINKYYLWRPGRTKVCILVGLITLCVCWMTMFSGFMIAELKTQDIDVDVDSYLARHGSQAASVLSKLANRTADDEVMQNLIPASSETGEIVIIETDHNGNTIKDLELLKQSSTKTAKEGNATRQLELVKQIDQFMLEEEVERLLALVNNTETSSLDYVNDEPVKWNNEPSPRLMDKLIGRWRQVRTVGLKEYLKAERENWIHQKMAAAAVPDFIYTKESENHYVQTIQVSIFPTEKYAIELDKWYEYKDHFGRKMRAFATDDGNVVHSTMLDGPVGPMTSVIVLIDDELYLTTIIDSQNVKAIRILQRVS